MTVTSTIWFVICNLCVDLIRPFRNRRLMHTSTFRLLVILLLAGTATVAAQQARPPALVTSAEILGGLPADGSRWVTFGGNYSNQRHSPLTQITAANVSRLVPKWTFQTNTLGNFET